MRWRAVWKVWLVVLALSGVAFGQTDAELALQAELTKIVREYEKTSGATVGVCFRDSRSGDIIAGLKSNRSFTPASNLKLLTSAVALKELGKDFEFSTKVYLAGQDVIVVGDFDPTLGDAKLAEATKRTIYTRIDAWVTAAKAELGGQSVNDIILVCPGTAADWRNPNWKPSQFDFWYAAPVAAINFNDNCLDVTFKVAGGRATATVTPASRFIEIKNTVRVEPRHQWGLRATADLSSVTVFGKVQQTTTEPLSVAVGNPPMLLGRVLADRFAEQNVAVAGEIRVVEETGDLLDDAIEIAETTTPIKHVLWRVNRHSLNMAAESLLLRTGDGTWKGSLEMMGETLVEDFGLDADDFTLQDGSGLAAGNKVTPGAMTDVLAQVIRSDGGKILAASLPKSGTSGKLVDRMDDAATKGRVLGKTGYIVGTQALSGYILDDRKRPVVSYSILINGVPGGQGSVAQATQDSLCRLVVEYLDADND